MLGRTTTEVAKIRGRLIHAGDLYPVRDGWVALAQPMFVRLAPYAYTETEADVADVPTIREMGERMTSYVDGRSAREVTTGAEIDAIMRRNRSGCP